MLSCPNIRYQMAQFIICKYVNVLVVVLLKSVWIFICRLLTRDITAQFIMGFYNVKFLGNDKEKVSKTFLKGSVKKQQLIKGLKNK